MGPERDHDNDHGDAHDHGDERGLEHRHVHRHAHRHDELPEHRHDASHDHAHGHGRHVAGRRALAIALGMTAVVCAAEAAAGWITGSLALLSDAAHMLTDGLGLAVALVAAALRTTARGGRSTFGLRRLPVLGGLVNALLVLGAAGLIVFEAIERLGAPRSIPGGPVILVALLGLMVNVLCAWLLHRSGDESVNMRGAMLHMLGDALGSVAALASGVVLLTSSFTIVDPIASLVVAGIIAVGSVRLLSDVGSILLERAPAHVNVEAVAEAARSVPGVEQVVGLHAWELDSGEAVASLVLVTRENDLGQLAAHADDLRRTLQARFGIRHATIEWRPMTSPRPCCDVDEIRVAHGHAAS